MNYDESVLAEFNEAIKQRSSGTYVFKLYVIGSSTRSANAVMNVRSFCEHYLSGRYDLEVIDVYQQPELASAQQLLAAPTLIKQSPEPERRLVGDLSDHEKVLAHLDIQFLP